jgi:predicted MFS family arabinose efflux permease
MVIPALFLFNAGFTFFTTFWGIVLVEQFGFKQGQVGNFFAYLGIMIILAQGGFVRRLSGKVRDYKVLDISMFLTAICLLIYYYLPSSLPVGIYLVPPVLAIGTALTKAFSSALITRLSPPEALGEAMGVSSSANALAQVIPSLLAGYIAAHHARLPVLVGAIVVFCAGFIFITSYNLRQKA